MTRHLAALFAVVVLAGTPAASVVCAAACLTPAAEPAAVSCSSGHATTHATSAGEARVDVAADAPVAAVASAPVPCCVHGITTGVAGSVTSSRDVPRAAAPPVALGLALANLSPGRANDVSPPRPPRPRSLPGAPLVLRI